MEGQGVTQGSDAPAGDEANEVTIRESWRGARRWSTLTPEEVGGLELGSLQPSDPRLPHSPSRLKHHSSRLPWQAVGTEVQVAGTGGVGLRRTSSHLQDVMDCSDDVAHDDSPPLRKRPV